MNAVEARLATLAAREKSGASGKKSISRLLAIVHGAIAQATRNGDSQVQDPFAGLRMMISETERKAVYDQIKAEGYKVGHLSRLKKTGPNTLYISW